MFIITCTKTCILRNILEIKILKVIFHCRLRDGNKNLPIIVINVAHIYKNCTQTKIFKK